MQEPLKVYLPRTKNKKKTECSLTAKNKADQNGEKKPTRAEHALLWKNKEDQKTAYYLVQEHRTSKLMTMYTISEICIRTETHYNI